MPYSHLAEAYVTCANLLEAGSTAGHFPTCISRGGTWLRFEQMITHTEGKQASIVPATRLFAFFILYISTSLPLLSCL